MTKAKKNVKAAVPQPKKDNGYRKLGTVWIQVKK